MAHGTNVATMAELICCVGLNSGLVCSLARIRCDLLCWVKLGVICEFDPPRGVRQQAGRSTTSLAWHAFPVRGPGRVRTCISPFFFFFS